MERDFVDRYNHELIDIHRVSPEGMGIHVQHLRGLIEQHVEATDSVWGAQLLNDFRSYIGKFWVVKPKAAAIDSLLEICVARLRTLFMNDMHFRARRQVGKDFPAAVNPSLEAAGKTSCFSRPGKCLPDPAPSSFQSFIRFHRVAVGSCMAVNHLQFLDIPRKDPDKLAVEVRTKEFREIYSQYSAEAAAQQAGRCISCGNPFCEWKCPVHNYIPNWLALVNDASCSRRGALASDELPAGNVRPNLPAG